ncbi:5'-methylthioadenosine/S-adenosylhomocysteine nucleosidase-like isoform X2 [Acropora muricata]|uniref:5'-methylthioadenosine/S-adenosylhomocysteine nucleosidase-like isoform X2 n=1 Tax=Acropora muricata TaxID=159855 RepID=UPI0034E55067
MSEAAAKSGFSEASLPNPPEVKDNVLKPEDLPERAVKWIDGRPPIDILLLTAKECELLSCLSYLNDDLYRTYKHELGGLLYLGEMGGGETKLKVAVIQCNMGADAPGGPTILVPKAVRALHPKAVICVGYCAGLKKEKVKLGDVIISSKLATYAPIEATGDGIIERGVQVPASPRLNGILKFADHGWKAPLKNAKDLKVKVHKDSLLLSGREVVSSDERRDKLKGRYPDAIALEMEGEGKISQCNDENCEVCTRQLMILA